LKGGVIPGKKKNFAFSDRPSTNAAGFSEYSKINVKFEKIGPGREGKMIY
jgi:hypothetical protein